MKERVHDLTKGQIKEAFANYTGAYHDAIESAVGLLPNANFILFDSSGVDLAALMSDKGVRLFAAGHKPFLDNWSSLLKDPPKLMQFYSKLIKERNLMEVRGQTAGNNYQFLKDFLELAALFHYHKNSEVRNAKGKKADQIRQRFQSRVEIVAVDYLIDHFATDVVIPIQNGNKRVMIPTQRTIADDIVGQLTLNHNTQAYDEIWERRDYDSADELDIEGFMGGHIVASGKHAFIGVNPYEIAIFRGDVAAAERELCRITNGLKRHVFKHRSVYNHIDTLLMPIDDDTVFLGDPIETERTLKRAGLSTENNARANHDYMDCYRYLSGELNRAGVRSVSVPFWHAATPGFTCMLSYCNGLQEERTFYAPRRSESDDARIAKIGAVLDDKFYRAASKYKNVSFVSGFNIPSAWTSAGLRCLINVTDRI